MKIVRRTAGNGPEDAPDWNLDPVLTRILRSRGVNSPAEAVYDLKNILPPNLLDLDAAAALLADAVMSGGLIMIAGDYDADGATATALALRFFRDIGYGNVCFEIPSRRDEGYGINRGIVLRASERGVGLIVTVDNGIAALDAVSFAASLGIRVIVTDHHIPGPELPDALAVVNPLRPGCPFPSKNLAGVGVFFYVAAGLRNELDRRGYFAARGAAAPNMSRYLDFVALGTVADMVPMDYNNRLMTDYGIKLVRNGLTTPGLIELIRSCGLSPQHFKVSDIVYSLCPRINAAGRMADMSFGVRCLLEENPDDAKAAAALLQGFNAERRTVETAMMETAGTQIRLEYPEGLPAALVLYNSSFNPGVMGVAAAKIRDRTGVSAVILADGPDPDLLVGSVRGTAGYNVCEALRRISGAAPEIFAAFGGHRGAAGLTIRRGELARFREMFILDCGRFAAAKTEEATVTDGELPSGYFVPDFARALVFDQPWGAEFAPPLFDGVFRLAGQFVVAGKHLNVKLQLDDGRIVSGIYYNCDTARWPDFAVTRVRAVYCFDMAKNSADSPLRIIVRGMEPA